MGENNKAVDNVLNINICEGACDEKCGGRCVDEIYNMIDNHPIELKEMEEKKLAYTPLHKAAAAGNTKVALELLRLMPSLGRKQDKGGSSPLHLAIEGNHRDTAIFMARFDKQLVRVKGKNGMTPLMQCAARPDSEEELSLLARLLVACPESVTDVNNDNQTVVHVALERRRCKAVCVLVDWLKRRCRISSVLSVKDLEGNTALHAAAQHGCLEGAKKLVDLVKLNRLNSKKESALDLANKEIALDLAGNREMVVELVTRKEIKKLLEDKGAKTKDEICEPKTTTEYVLSKETFPENVYRAFYYLMTDMTSEMRNTILVVATLIMAATYQAVLQPPGGVYHPPSDATDTSATKTLLTGQYLMGRRLGASNDSLEKQHEAGKMAMKKADFRVFMSSSTAAFVDSAVIVILVVPGRPVFLILHFCLVCMCVSYFQAVETISYYPTRIFYTSLFAIFGAYYIKLWYYSLKVLLIDDDWWLRGLSVALSNYFTTATGGFLRAILNEAYKFKKQHMVLRLPN